MRRLTARRIGTIMTKTNWCAIVFSAPWTGYYQSKMHCWMGKPVQQFILPVQRTGGRVPGWAYVSESNKIRITTILKSLAIKPSKRQVKELILSLSKLALLTSFVIFKCKDEPQWFEPKLIVEYKLLVYDPDYSDMHRCQPSRNRAGNPAFWRISRIPAFFPERPAFLALFWETNFPTNCDNF